MLRHDEVQPYSATTQQVVSGYFPADPQATTVPHVLHFYHQLLDYNVSTALN